MLVRDPVGMTTLPLLVSGLLLNGASARYMPRLRVNERRRPRAVRGAGLPVRTTPRGYQGVPQYEEKSRPPLRSAHEQRPGEVCLQGCCPGGRELGAAVHSYGQPWRVPLYGRDAGELSLGPAPRRFSVAASSALSPPPPPPPSHLHPRTLHAHTRARARARPHA